MTCPVCQAENGPADPVCVRCGTRLQPEARSTSADFILPEAASAPPQRLTGPLALGGAAALLLGALFALFWVSTASPPGTPRPGAAGEIIAAVQANNNAQIAALRTLDPHALDGKMAGSALDDTRALVADLQGQNHYEEARLVHIDYSAPVFPSGNQASIRTVEQWQSTVRIVGSGQFVRQDPLQTLHETYYLTRRDGQWIVEQVAIQEDNGTPVPVP